MQTQTPLERPSRSPLFYWRSANNLTQQDAADRLRLSQAHYGKVENGEVLPRRDKLAEMEVLSGVKGFGASIVLYHFAITEDDAAAYFRRAKAHAELT